MEHDRIHAQPPSHDTDRWSVGTIESIETQDGHCIVTVRTAQETEQKQKLTVTIAVRDLFLRRLDVGIDVDDITESALDNAIGERVWYRVRGE
ncbi:MAG: hypothetical protein J07HQW1_03560 [Haloquadratum walsbyi J07HQW1]|jgi:hypothetical protein|uniref:Uncharacterized protein n=1 Tax=Haloquadratum walsbyi J07HQW1 TaxID=1238424 RepID=U1PIM3_9EURY|nr:MAG: hypothetical protein J07HQW1_03560 [Haloquadratum walsbyi J07HQW1]